MIIILLQGAGQWFELQDLHVQDLLPQMITLAEAYIQVCDTGCPDYLKFYFMIADMGAENRRCVLSSNKLIFVDTS